MKFPMERHTKITGQHHSVSLVVPSTTTITVSQVETLTVPTLNGFVPVESASPGAAKKTNSWEVPDGWDVQDVYWTTEPSTATNVATRYHMYTDLLWRRDRQSDQPTKVDCTETVQSNSFFATSYIRVTGPRATLTRTEIVATATSTYTVESVATSPSSTAPSSTSTTTEAEPPATSAPSTDSSAPIYPYADSSCSEYYTVTDGDYCLKIEEDKGVTIDQLRELNSGLKGDCTNLWLGYQYCVKA